MRFQVPQFIEVEDKIFGPLTLKQFLYLAGSGGLIFIIYSFIGNLFITILFVIPIAGIGLALAFYKINNKPFIFVLEAALKYYFSEKLYIWRKKEKEVVANQVIQTADTSNFYIPKLSDSKLKDLTWSLDIKQAQNPVTGNKRNNV
jgi:hypothetical protein